MIRWAENLSILCYFNISCHFQLRDEETPKGAQETNWFSAPSALSIYGHYLNLDKDHNGMLSKAELGGYGSGTLTTVFLDRLFAECITYDGENFKVDFFKAIFGVGNNNAN